MNVLQGVTGTIALARGERGWEDRLDLSASGVFASFGAVALSIPAIILTAEVQRQILPGMTDLVAVPGPVTNAVVSVATILAAWAASVLILARLASRTGAGWRVTPLLVGYNWSRLIVYLTQGLVAAAAILTGWGVLVGLLGLPVLILSIWLAFGVVRHALDLKPGQAVGVLLMLLLARVLATLLVSVFAAPFLPDAPGA